MPWGRGVERRGERKKEKNAKEIKKTAAIKRKKLTTTGCLFFPFPSKNKLFI